jgi:hypothetical protein
MNIFFPNSKNKQTAEGGLSKRGILSSNMIWQISDFAAFACNHSYGALHLMGKLNLIKQTQHDESI